MDHPDVQSQAGDVESPGQKQARTRRERREAKIRAGGSARLEKITNVSGRQNLPEAPTAIPPSHSNDPEEVDLSTHPSAARTLDSNVSTEADIQSILRGSGSSNGTYGAAQESRQPSDDDPFMKIFQQMMGSPPDACNDDSAAGLPPGFEALLGAGSMMGMPGLGHSQQRENKSSYLWKILHAVFSVLLGIYVTAKSHAFNGDVTRGGIDGAGHEGGANVFWAFATAELVLQSSRFFYERGHESQLGGWMGIVGNMLPEPYISWIKLAGRYSGIWSTVVEDGMVVIFVLGVVAWWKGAVG